MAAANPELIRTEGPRLATVLVADDDQAIRLVLRDSLQAAGFAVEEAVDSQSTLDALRTGRFDVALIDIVMPGAGGLEVLSIARTEEIRTLMIIITAASTMNNAVEAMKRGAHDYLTKPFANLDLVAAAVARASEVAAQSADFDRLRSQVSRTLVGGEIIGRSAPMQEVYKLIGKVVNNDALVLLTGAQLIERGIKIGPGQTVLVRVMYQYSFMMPFIGEMITGGQINTGVTDSNSALLTSTRAR